MCDLTQGFRLCSCAANELAPEDIGWILKRINHDIMPPPLVGTTAINFTSLSEAEIKKKLLHLLNTTACFDFEYQPKESDFLYLRVNLPNHHWFHFSYLNGAWKEERQNHLSTWQRQLEHYKQGKIELLK